MSFLHSPNKGFLITSVILLSFSASIIGLQVIHALGAAQSKDQSPQTTQKANKDSTMTSNTETKSDEEKNAEKAAQEAATKQSNQGAAKQAPAAVLQSIVTASPRGKKLYVDASAKIGQPSEIASQSTALWLGGWNADIGQAANTAVTNAARQGAVATFVLYNIPNRDCGSYSSGGASSSQSYRSWVRAVAAGIGAREAIVIIEPDALSQITSCLSGADQAARYADLSDAVTVLSAQTKAFIYLDAGHSNWIDANTMADRLAKANVAQARGFSLNVSSFQTTSSSTQYGNSISAKTGKSFVIDTSRNGQGPNGGEWCNPRGRGLGKRPTTSASGNVDAYLWVKVPGESDGECNNGPSAGTWWNDYAQELIRNAVY
jgi:endoglucanase